MISARTSSVLADGRYLPYPLAVRQPGHLFQKDQRINAVLPKPFQVHGLYSCGASQNRGCSCVRMDGKTNPGSAGEQPGPPAVHAASEFEAVPTWRDIKPEADCNWEPVGSKQAELFSKHDFVMLRGAAPRTPNSKATASEGQEVEKTHYGHELEIRYDERFMVRPWGIFCSCGFNGAAQNEREAERIKANHTARSIGGRE